MVKEEVFGPVVVMDSYATFKDAVAKYVLAPSARLHAELHQSSDDATVIWHW